MGLISQLGRISSASARQGRACRGDTKDCAGFNGGALFRVAVAGTACVGYVVYVELSARVEARPVVRRIGAIDKRVAGVSVAHRGK